MTKDKWINFEDGYTSVNFPKFGEGEGPRIFSADYAFDKGEKDASKFSEEELINMLKGQDYEQIYEALGAISQRRLKKALPYLRNIALYDEDLEIQREAIRTIRRIGGRGAMDILRFLKTTEHKKFIEELLE